MSQLPPTVRSPFFRYLNCIFLGLIIFCGSSRSLCPNREHKNTQNHTLRSIPVVHSYNVDNKDRHVIIAGDFNCPDIDWDSLSVQNTAHDNDVQQSLIDLAIDFNLTQVHDQTTRESNLLDLVFTTNPSLVKSTNNAPGVSDHDMIIDDSDTKPFYTKQRPKKCPIIYLQEPTGTI